MELIILGLGGSLCALLSHLLEFICQRRGRALSAVASEAQTALQRQAELQTNPRVVAFPQPPAGQNRERPSQRCA